MKFESSTNKNPPSIQENLRRAEEERIKKINYLRENKIINVFKEGDVVTLNKKYSKHGAEYSRIMGKHFVVKESKFADLTDMNPEVLYFEDCDSNPFLASHFIKV